MSFDPVSFWLSSGLRLFQPCLGAQTDVSLLMVLTPTKSVTHSKPTEAFYICKYSTLCRSYIGTMFAFVAMATDIWP